MLRVTRTQVAEEGLERPSKTPGKTGDSQTGDAESDVNGAILRRIAAELRGRFSADQCRRLAALLTAEQAEGGA